MVRKVSDARKALDWMLDAHEADPAREYFGIIARPDYGKMARGSDVTRFHDLLRRAETVGAICIEPRKDDKDLVERVRLRSPEALYGFLNRTPRLTETTTALAEVRSAMADLPGFAEEILAAVEEAWRCGRPALGTLKPGDAPALRIILTCVLSMVRQEHVGLDLRTFSQRVTGNSKALEEQAARLAEALRFAFPLPDGARGMDALAALGLEKFPSPVLLRGEVEVARHGRILARPFVGLPREWIERLTLTRRPGYVMTIENLASFNRYVREVDDDGLVVFSGGYPSRAVSELLRHLDHLLPLDVPAWHWGDIDRYGFLIADTIGGLMTRPVARHMMEHERAGAEGRLEQEALDPMAPMKSSHSFSQRSGPNVATSE